MLNICVASCSRWVLIAEKKMEPGGCHHHMVCTATVKIIEFWDADLDERLRRLCQEHKFRPSFISIQIQGLSGEGQKVEQDTSFF